MAQVWVYQDGYRNIGDVHFEVEWATVKPEAMEKDDLNIDRDVVYNVEYYPTLPKARKRAHQIFKAVTTEPVTSAFGVVQIQKQMVGIDEDTGYGEWQNVGDSIEIS